MPKFGNRYIEDPSIAQCAALEYERLWARIEAGVEEGEPFFVAREKILALEIPVISKRYGKVVGNRVSKAIQHTPMSECSGAINRSYSRMVLQEKLAKKGKLSWWDRLCYDLSCAGIPVW
jgi:hypothetical protein